MKKLCLAILACWYLCSPARADNMPVVVELFTSQGCSSCPPADEMMHVLSDREDVIALSLHVDYWDYIGWEDEFADPRNAERQKAYALVAGRKSIYTPEMIVNGVSDILGARPMELAMAIEKHKAEERSVGLEVIRIADDRLGISVSALRQNLDEMDVHVLRYQPARSSRILRGENAGKTIEYVNVTQDWQKVARWDGQAALDLEVDVPSDFPVVVLIQSTNHGPIRAAARLVPDN